MSRHIHWYYYYDIVVSLTQTTLEPAIINILTRWPQIYTNIVWGHLISALCNLCMAQLWVEGRRRWWLLRLESSWWWRTEMTSTAIFKSTCLSVALIFAVAWAGWIQSQVSRYVRSPELQGAGSVKWNWAECVTMSRGAVSRRWRLSRALDTGHLHTAPRPSLIAPHFSRFVVDKEGAEGRHQEALQGHHWRLCPLFVLEHRLVSSASVSLEVVNFCCHFRHL